MTKYYLAHPTKLRKEVKKWKSKMSAESIDLVCPFSDVPGEPIRLLDEGKYKDLKTYYADLDPRFIVMKDFKTILECDGVVAWVDGTVNSYGTIMEIEFAGMMKKKVYIYVKDTNDVNHPWLKFWATKTFDKLEDLEKELRGVFKNEFR